MHQDWCVLTELRVEQGETDQKQVKREEMGFIRGWDAQTNTREVSQVCTKGKVKSNKETKGKGE